MFRSIFMVLATGGFLTTGTLGQAQDLPASQIWLAKLDHHQITGLSAITSAGRYNNQPHFSPDSEAIFFTAEQSDGQTDIAVYRIKDQVTSLVMASPESEYSPTPIPGREAVSVIRVELPENRQRLWQIPLSGEEPELLMPGAEPVGYHCWLDTDTAALFILGESFSLQKSGIGENSPEFLYDNIGRTLRRHPHTGAILFTDKNQQPWTISALQPGGSSVSPILALFPDGEDFEVDQNGRYWTGLGSKLYQSDPGNHSWRLFAELSGYGIHHISRLASSPDGQYLAIVSSP